MTSSSQSADGVLVLAYGGPANLDEVEPFMCELLGTRPSEGVCDRVRRRYLAVGGSSPLPKIAGEFAAALEACLAKAGTPVRVDTGFRYTAPRITETLVAMYRDGVRRVVTVALSPFESKTTTHAYRSAVAAAIVDLSGMEVVEAPLLSRVPAFTQVHAELLRATLTALPETVREKVFIVFSAHSLPVEDLQPPFDQYVQGLQVACDRVAAHIGLESGSYGAVLPCIDAYGSSRGVRPWLLAYQSKGQRGGDWLGPALEDVIDAVAAQGFSAVAVCPIGFATEHMETLFDLDIIAANRARGHSMAFVRSKAPNTCQALVDAVGEVVRSLLGSGVATGP